MLIQYDDGPPALQVDELDPIKRGEPTEVPDDVAKRLLKQSIWRKSDEKSPAAKKQADAPKAASNGGSK